MKNLSAVTTLLAVGLATVALPAQPADVDAVLFLSADVSGSISRIEYGLQKTGYANAFRSAEVSNLFSENYKVAVAYGEWSSGYASVRTGWSILDSAADSAAFGDTLAALNRESLGGTNPALGINLGVSAINSGIGQAFSFNNETRVIIDVSGDGRGHTLATHMSRDMALAGVVDTINGITIGRSENLYRWYARHVAGGVDSFTVKADDFVAFEEAIKNKLIREIAPPVVPEPSTIGFLAVFGLGAFLFVRRRLTRKA